MSNKIKVNRIANRSNENTGKISLKKLVIKYWNS